MNFVLLAITETLELVYYTRNNRNMVGTRKREAVGTLATLSSLGTLRKLETAGRTFSLGFRWR